MRINLRHTLSTRLVLLVVAALCAVVPASMAQVAVHRWDVHGARAAGLVTGWASRLECRWPASMKRPDVTGDTVPEETFNETV